jgi:hypothetical protein
VRAAGQSARHRPVHARLRQRRAGPGAEPISRPMCSWPSPAPEGDHRCRDLRKLLRVVWPGPLLGQVLPEVLKHGGDAASASLKEVSVQGGKLRVGKDEGRFGEPLRRGGRRPLPHLCVRWLHQGWPGRLLPPRAGRSPQRGPRRCQSTRWDSLPWLSCTSARCSVSDSSTAGRRSAASGLNLARPRQ